MTLQHGVAVVTVPLPVVEERLRQVESWTAFLPTVKEIRKIGHERYAFRVCNARDGRDIPMVVRRHPRNHSFTWHVLAGPPFDGQLRLSPVPGGWTRIDVTATARPERFVDCLGEMLHLSATDHVIDLVLL